MSSSTIAFEAAFRDLVEAVRRHTGPPLAQEEILAYLEGELSAEEEERLQNRLVLDPQAIEAVLIRQDPRRLERTQDVGTPPLAPTWDAIRERLAADEGPELLVVPARRKGVHPLYRWAAAALLILTAGVLLWGTQRMRGTPGTELADQRSGPRINALYQELIPVDTSIPRAASHAEAVTVAPGTPLLLILHIGNRGSYSEYSLEIRASDGSVRWRAGGLQPLADGSFSVELPADFLPPGLYELLLHGGSGEGTNPVATYRLHVSQP